MRYRHYITDVMQYLWCCVDAFTGSGESMLSQDLIVAATQLRPPALIEGSGRKLATAFLRAAIDGPSHA